MSARARHRHRHTGTAASAHGFRQGFSGAAGLWLAALAGCVDTEARYQDFLDRTGELRVMLDAGPVSAERVDFSGDYLLALSTVVSPDAPILFATRAQVSSDLATVALELQPLATDTSEPPRAPVGEPIVAPEAPYAPDGTFEADLGTVQVPGAANPITGSDITATVRIRGLARPDGAAGYFFCGEALGMVTVPLALDLAGSSFGAVPSPDVQDAVPLLACPEDPADR